MIKMQLGIADSVPKGNLCFKGCTHRAVILFDGAVDSHRN